MGAMAVRDTSPIRPASGVAEPLLAAERRGSVSIPALIRAHQLATYFVLAYAVSWGLLYACLVALRTDAASAILIQTLGPTVAARIVLTAVGGRPKYRQMRLRARQWRVPLRWYLVALVGIPAACLAAVVALPGGLDALEHAAPLSMLGTYAFFMVAGFFSGPLFEEPGWRGFALPRLQTSMGPLAGTLVLGVLWGAWHLPQFLVPAWAAQNGGSDPGTIVLFLVLVVTLAPLLTWVYNRTGGSLFLAMLTHAGINASLSMIPAFRSGPMVVGVLAFGTIAITLIVTTRGRLGYNPAVEL